MNRKHDADERNAAQPVAGEPRADDDDNEAESPDRVPSLLTARELQARDPVKGDAKGDEKGEASLDDDDEPPSAARGKPAPKAQERQNAGRRTR